MSDDNKIKVIPKVEKTSNIQLDDIRMFMLDNLTSENVLGTDHYFSDDEIEDAVKRTIDEYNSIPPLSITVSYGNLRLNSILLNGIAWQLCLSKLLALQRRDVSYNSGDTQVDIVGKQIAHLMQNREYFKNEFKEKVMQQKRALNMHRAFRTF